MHIGSNSVRVLVVDDEDVIHLSLRRVLEKRGFDLTCVFTVADALQELEAQPFQLILTDLKMPGADGLQLLSRLKGLGVTTPVVMITGYPTVQTAIQAMRLGAAEYITKPFTADEILAPINRVLRRSGPSEESSAATPTDAEHYLPHHAWVRSDDEDHCWVGVEATFLAAVGVVEQVLLPDCPQRIEQGLPCFSLINARGEEHQVLTPISGEVVAVNPQVATLPEQLRSHWWVLRVRPSALEAELALLVSR